MRVLIVEDDKKIARAIERGLTQEGYAVDVEYDGEAGYLAATSEAYDVLLTDIMMPKMDGFEVIRRLRQERITTPILALTARGQASDMVEGLDSGADDYVAKPFSFDVLLARVRALLRRPSEVSGAILQVGDIEIDPAKRRVTREGREIALSVREFAILEYLARHTAQTVSKETIIAHVWNFDADVLPNTVEVFVKNIREKLEKPFPKKPRYIKTVRGFGYRLEAMA